MKKNLLFFVMIALLAIFTVACGAKNETTEPVAGEEVDSQTETDTEGAETEEAEQTEITIEHDLGETTVPVNPEKVLVYDMGVLDTIDTLGVDAVTGVPTDSVPEYLSKYKSDEYTNVGTLFEPAFETVYDLEPDLIIISGRAADAYEELSEIAPTIFMGVDSANYIESFTHNVETLATIFDIEEVGKEAIAKIDESLNELNEKATASEANGLLLMASEGALSAYGLGSRFGILHNEFGVTAVDENIEVSKHGQNVSFEYIVEKDPDYLFVVDRGAVVSGAEGQPTGQETVENELVKGTKAYKEGNIVYLNPVYWYISAGGLTSVAGMIEEVNAAIK